MTELTAGVVAISRKTKSQGFPGKCHCCCCFSRLPGGTGLGQALGNSSKGIGGNSEAPAEKTVACKSYEFESNVILILRLQKYFLFLFQPPGTEGRGEGLVHQSVVTKEHSR